MKLITFLKYSIIILVIVIPIFMMVADVIAPYVRPLGFLRGMLPINHVLSKYGIEEKDIPSLKGKMTMVTGSSSGIGYGTAKLLAKKGATVIMACRSMHKCEEAKKKILSEVKTIKSEQLICELLDLNSLKDVTRFAQKMISQGYIFDSVIHNAGIMYPPFELTEDGFESTWGVDVVGPHLLAVKLLPYMNPTGSSVVFVSSNAIYSYELESEEDINKFNDPKLYNPQLQYGRAKLANIYQAVVLGERMVAENRKVYVNSVHPGGVSGMLYRHLYWIPGAETILGITMKLLFWTEDQAGLSLVATAFSPSIYQEQIQGAYFIPVFRRDIATPKSRDKERGRRWINGIEKVLKEKGFL
jgi:NAD(P)-dependent dehydrogenase (short-subunit alcohol dehydrogenase family)